MVDEKKREYNIRHREKKKQELLEIEEKVREKMLLQKEKNDIERDEILLKREIKAPKKQEIEDDSEDLVLDKDAFDKLVDEKAKEKALFFLHSSKNKKETPEKTDHVVVSVVKSTAKNMMESLLMMSIPFIIKVGVGYFKNSSPPPITQSQMLQNLQLQRQQQQSESQSPDIGIVF